MRRGRSRRPGAPLAGPSITSGRGRLADGAALWAQSPSVSSAGVLLAMSLKSGGYSDSEHGEAPDSEDPDPGGHCPTSARYCSGDSPVGVQKDRSLGDST